MTIMSTRRRIAAALLAPALAAGLVLAAPTAQAATNDAEDSAAAWLAAQPVDGVFTTNSGGFIFVDHGLNLDLYAALAKLGQTEKAEEVYDATIADADAYTDAYGTRYAGALGKLSAMVQIHGDDARSLDGRNLIDDLEALVVTEGAATGRARDVAEDPEDPYFYESSNAIGQAWVVRALTTAGSELDDETAAYLLKQQCDDGSFRLTMSDVECTTGTGSAEVTSFAIQALDVADAAGVADFDAEIDAAIDWLLAEQGADGSFSDEGAGTPNTNSTGLAAVALRSHGETGAAASAAGWVADRQVTSGPEAGAIALNDADLAAAGTIEDLDRDRYVRASVQAVLGLDALLPATALTVDRSARFVAAGKTVTITAADLEPGEKATFAMTGAATSRSTADETGTATGTFTTPSTSGTRRVTVQGSGADRAGSVSVTVLAARKLAPKLRYTTVKRGKSQQVTVAGLAGSEPVKIRFSGKTVKTAVASASGTYSYYFKVTGVAPGKRTVTVTGAFSNRTGAKSFTVR